MGINTVKGKYRNVTFNKGVGVELTYSSAHS